jgi:hypothetical protein
MNLLSPMKLRNRSDLINHLYRMSLKKLMKHLSRYDLMYLKLLMSLKYLMRLKFRKCLKCHLLLMNQMSLKNRLRLIYLRFRLYLLYHLNH